MNSLIPNLADGYYRDESLSIVSNNNIAGPSRNILADYETVANSKDEDDIPTIKQVHSDISDASVKTVSYSSVSSLKKGIIKTSKGKANRPYTSESMGLE